MHSLKQRVAAALPSMLPHDIALMIAEFALKSEILVACSLCKTDLLCLIASPIISKQSTFTFEICPGGMWVITDEGNHGFLPIVLRVPIYLEDVERVDGARGCHSTTLAVRPRYIMDMWCNVYDNAPSTMFMAAPFTRLGTRAYCNTFCKSAPHRALCKLAMNANVSYLPRRAQSLRGL